MRLRIALVTFCATLIGHVMAAEHRLNTTAADVISNISDVRFTNLTAQWGGSSNITNQSPNWGQMIFHTIHVYPDFLGQVGWLLLFGIPFIMMWIAHADMTAAGIVGIGISMFVFSFIGSQYQWTAIGMMLISATAIGWSIYQKRG